MSLNKHMIITDLDGTLLNDEKEISFENLNSIKDFREKGGVFSLSTGRNIISTRDYNKVLNLNYPIIAFNGAAIYDFNSDKVIFEKCIPENSLKIARELIDKFPEIGCEVLDLKHIFVAKNNEHEQRHLKLCGENLGEIYCDLEEINPKNLYKILFAMPPRLLDEINDYAVSHYEEVDFVKSSDYLLELIAKDVSKGDALTFYRDQILKDDKMKIYAVGDYNNDIEMLVNADVGIAVSNSSESLKQNADIVIEKTNEEDAISYVIENIIYNKAL